MKTKFLSLLFLITTQLYAQEQSIVVGGDRNPAFVNDVRVTKWFNTKHLSYELPPDIKTVLIIGDHGFYGDTVKTYRVLEWYRKDGEHYKNMVHTNNNIHIYHFVPTIIDSIYVSEVIIKYE